MKKYLFLYVVVFACFAETSFAQLQINNPLTQKKPLLQIPVVQILPVSNLIVPVHIDFVKPIVVSINTTDLMNKAKAKCASLKNLQSSLILKAERANNVSANLQWETKYAFYAMGFNIERSLADTFHFTPVKFATASTASSFKKNYHLPDYNDYSSVSFYRIKQLNRDTGFTYSNIVSIKGYEAMPFRIYPIPASDRLWIDIAPKQSGNLVIMVYDLAGKMVQQQSTSCTENRLAVQSIDISNLAAGLYQVRILMPDKTFLTGKFIKK